MTEKIEHLESTVLDWMTDRKKPSKPGVLLDPSPLAAIIHTRVGAVASISLLACYLSMCVTFWGGSAGGWADERLLFLPKICIAVGLLSLVALRLRPQIAWSIILVFTCILFPVLIYFMSVGDIRIVMAQVMYLNGLTLLYFEPRWQLMDAQDRNGRLWSEFWGGLLLPCVPLLSIAAVRDAPWSWLFIGGLGLLLISYSAFRTHNCMICYLAALREDGDEDGWRSTLLTMACIWLWPVWIFDRRGLIITGGRCF